MIKCNERFCVNCKFEDHGQCKSPLIRMKVNCITGETEPRWKYCSSQREDDWLQKYMFGTCGKVGRFFEEIEK